MTRTLQQHLTASKDGQKRMLALDGGGVMGVIEIAFLEKIEALLRKRHGNSKLVLSDYFDLIGGTSTGSIIATSLALGMPVADVKKLYFEFAPAIFRRPLLSVPYFTPRFSERGLIGRLQSVLGDRTLDTPDLKTGLAIISKRIDTGSVWVLTNNPESKFWNDTKPGPEKGATGHLGNRHYKLRDIVRASTAAPFYFAPHQMKIIDKEPDGLFVDGGVSPHNNPALMLLMLAGIKGYGFNWPMLKERLMMISIGAGWVRPRITLRHSRKLPASLLAVNTLRGVIWDGQMNALTILQWISEPRIAWEINSEIGGLRDELINENTTAEKIELLQFQRYDVELCPAWLKLHAGEELSEEETIALNQVMNPEVMPTVYKLASKCAEKQVSSEDFPEIFDLQEAKVTSSI